MDVNDWSDEDKESLGTFLRWNSYRSNDHQLFYVSTPKVACTSLKWWFASLEGYAEAIARSTDSSESDPDLFVHDVFHKVAPDVVGMPLEELSQALTSPSYLRFAVVRNPYKRVFSAWQSKLLLREPLQVGHCGDQDLLDLPIDTAADIAAAFERFMEYLATQEAPHYKDYHWTPQANILRPDLINYTRIAKIEEPHDLIGELNRWLGSSAVDPFSVRRANESIIPFLPELLTPRSVELIRELYARDFELFGYGSRVPSSGETFNVDQWDVALKAVKLIRARHITLGQRNNQIADLKSKVMDSEGNLANLRTAQVGLEEAEATKASLRDAIVRYKEAEALRQSMEDRLRQSEASHEETKASLREAIARRQEIDSSFSQMEIQLRDAEAQRDDVGARLDRAEKSVYALSEELGRIINSRSWRITAPLRNIIRFAFLLRTNLTAFGRLLPRPLRRLRRKISWWKAVREVRASKLFDASYYRSKYPDVATSGIDPATHFVVQGWKEFRNPSTIFHTAEYLSFNQDVAKTGMNPLVHYLRFGHKEGRQIRAAKASDVFDVNAIEKPVDVRQAMDAQEQVASEIEAIRLSGWFDEQFYLATYPELALEADAAIQHYCEHGWRAGLNPSDDFDTKFYLSTYHDVRDAAINPFWHYVIAGIREARQASPRSSG